MAHAFGAAEVGGFVELALREGPGARGDRHDAIAELLVRHVQKERRIDAGRKGHERGMRLAQGCAEGFQFGGGIVHGRGFYQIGGAAQRLEWGLRDQDGRTAMASTSRRAPRGKAAAWTQERAGNGAENMRE